MVRPAGRVRTASHRGWPRFTTTSAESHRAGTPSVSMTDTPRPEPARSQERRLSGRVRLHAVKCNLGRVVDLSITGTRVRRLWGGPGQGAVVPITLRSALGVITIRARVVQTTRRHAAPGTQGRVCCAERSTESPPTGAAPRWGAGICLGAAGLRVGLAFARFPVRGVTVLACVLQRPAQSLVVSRDVEAQLVEPRLQVIGIR